jgi:hypothetical protein
MMCWLWNYLPPRTPRKWAVPIWSTKWKEDADKYLAHITYQRTEDRPGKGLPHWDHTVWVPQLRVEFNKAWWDFRESVIDGAFGESEPESLGHSLLRASSFKVRIPAAP